MDQDERPERPVEDRWRDRVVAWRATDGERVSSTVVLLTRTLHGLEANAVQAVVAAWPNLAHRFSYPSYPPPKEDGAAWWALWGRLEDMVPDIMRGTGLNLRDATAAVRIAVTNRMVYPDGTLSKGAGAFLMAESATVLRKRVGPVKPPDSPKASDPPKALGNP